MVWQVGYEVVEIGIVRFGIPRHSRWGWESSGVDGQDPVKQVGSGSESIV